MTPGGSPRQLPAHSRGPTARQTLSHDVRTIAGTSPQLSRWAPVERNSREVVVHWFLPSHHGTITTVTPHRLQFTHRIRSAKARQGARLRGPTAPSSRGTTLRGCLHGADHKFRGLSPWKPRRLSGRGGNVPRLEPLLLHVNDRSDRTREWRRPERWFANWPRHPSKSRTSTPRSRRSPPGVSLPPKPPGRSVPRTRSKSSTSATGRSGSGSGCRRTWRSGSSPAPVPRSRCRPGCTRLSSRPRSITTPESSRSSSGTGRSGSRSCRAGPRSPPSWERIRRGS